MTAPHHRPSAAVIATWRAQALAILRGDAPSSPSLCTLAWAVLARWGAA